MIVRLIKKSRIYNFTLPTIINGNYWISDEDELGNNRNLINVEEYNGQWKIKSDFETKIMSGNKEVSSAILSDYALFFLKINDNEYVILYCSPSYENNIKKLQVSKEMEIIIGNSADSHISYNYPVISNKHARLFYKNNTWVIQDLNSKYGTYVNNEVVVSKNLKYGDIIFIMGLKIIVLKDYLVVNEIGNLIKINMSNFHIKEEVVQKQIEFDNSEEEVVEFFNEQDYFYRSPRFKTKIEDVNIIIDSPPAKENKEKMPAIYTIGPMLTMSMMSVSMGYTSLSGVIDGTKDISDAIPTLIITFAMLSTMLLWPLLSKTFQKRQQVKREKERQKKYSEYIEVKRQEIKNEMEKQRQILIDNYLPLEETNNIIVNKKRNLWEREIAQDDFLDLRIGIGSTLLSGNIKFPEKHFSIEEDNLLEEVYKLGAESRILENVPISTSFIKNNVSAIIGNGDKKIDFIKGLLLQMMTYHSYEDLKIVFLTNEKNKSNWEFLKVLPHCWSDDKTIRYFATTLDEVKELSLSIEKEFQHRKTAGKEEGKDVITKDYRSHKPYYIVVTDNYKNLRDVEIIKDIASSKINLGFSLIVISPRLINLPNETKTFISIGDKKSGIFENELVSNKQKEFTADYLENIDIYNSCKRLANIPIDMVKENRKLPNSVSFLEMYNVGMIEQLNILNRWKNNDPINSLAAPVGVDQSQELFKLDLHEKFYGPHGLVAGMTGSGKSEFLITYILSMALNYHPYEVSFVIIDYKGGGLAGIFENKETGFKLPHLAGTITNLDIIEMNRSLSSIQSELRRRQKMFNKARDTLDESTIDIYKYQSLYRKGLVKEPISHLFIISDEFAELKTQQPEFMEQLISIARIGRSLGVHLILATQKPSGVVNDQIWSNSKFRVCLKVQDRSDSMDMIKVPDAATLKNPGRFYLQVGYNELFAMGQSSWAGAQYYPTEKRKKKVDTSVNIIDNVGNTVKSLENKKNDQILESQGEEVTNIVKYIVNISNEEKINVEQLWLDRIPEVIYIDDLKNKYNYIAEKNVINPIIGEYDDPNNQKQGLLTLPLSLEGNTIIFGSAGSGKELMISSLIYSTITNHMPEEVNFYLVDFGAETLTMFRDIPHVGDVLLSIDDEKIKNLFKMLSQTIEDRKKLFVEYNGSYNFYINHSGKELPLIVVVINNIEAMSDAYSEYSEILEQMTRDCLKYGIVFILTTSAPNTVRYRIKQNFKQNIALQLNDASDYSSVIPNVRKKIPSSNIGRGLVTGEDIYEFQTAYLYKEEHISEYLKVIASKFKTLTKNVAIKIPILPEVVSYEYVESKMNNMKTIPVGIEKESLGIATVDFTSQKNNIITSSDITETTNLIDSLIKVLISNNKKVSVIDSQSLLTNTNSNPNISYTSTNFISIIDKLRVSNKDEIFILVGLNSLLSKITPNEKVILEKALSAVDENIKNKLVIVDNVDNIKIYAYNPWFKTGFDIGEAIWVGNGITDQFVLRVTNSHRELRAELDNRYGYVIKKGKAIVVKFISIE